MKIYGINNYFHLQGCFMLPFMLGISKYLAWELTNLINHVYIEPDLKQKKKVKSGVIQVANLKSNIIN